MTVYEFEEGGGDSFMQQQVFGYNLWVLLVIMTIVFVAFLLLSMCWQYCAKDDKDSELQAEPVIRSNIVVREVRPGLLVIQGNSPDETARVIREYEAIRHQMVHNQGYGGCANTDYPGMDNMSSWGSCSSFPSTAPTQQRTNIHGSASQLIDLNSENRPPPYAPHNQ